MFKGGGSVTPTLWHLWHMMALSSHMGAWARPSRRPQAREQPGTNINTLLDPRLIGGAWGRCQVRLSPTADRCER